MLLPKDTFSDKVTHIEPQSAKHKVRLNYLRAAVLGANDGVVSIAGLVAGVAGATDSIGVIFTAGVAGIIAGSISMAAGEYVSVSSQRDSEKALLSLERKELRDYPDEELAELADIYLRKGLQKSTAMQVAKELTKHNAFIAHAEVELGIDPHNLINPWHAAFASATAFLAGAIIPLVAILVPPSDVRIPVAFASVVVALMVNGIISAKVGYASVPRAVFRVVLGGVLAMVVTYGIGKFFGVSGI